MVALSEVHGYLLYFSYNGLYYYLLVSIIYYYNTEEKPTVMEPGKNRTYGGYYDTQQ